MKLVVNMSINFDVQHHYQVITTQNRIHKVVLFKQHYFINSNLSPDDDVEHRNLLTLTTSFIYLQSSQEENK